MWQTQTDDEHGLLTPDTADLGLGVGNEDGRREFDTPTLVKTWRTGAVSVRRACADGAGRANGMQPEGLARCHQEPVAGRIAGGRSG